MPVNTQPPNVTSNKLSCCLLLLLTQDLPLASLSQQTTPLSVCLGSDLIISTPTHPGFITQMATIILAFAFAQSLIFRKLAGTQISIHLSKRVEIGQDSKQWGWQGICMSLISLWKHNRVMSLNHAGASTVTSAGVSGSRYRISRDKQLPPFRTHLHHSLSVHRTCAHPLLGFYKKSVTKHWNLCMLNVNIRHVSVKEKVTGESLT